MEVAKTFDRDGVRYRPGDPLPPNLDKQALEHYKRYGMVREAKPSEAKPAGQRQRKPVKPTETKPAGPSIIADGGQVDLNQGLQTDLQQEHVAEQTSELDSTADHGALDTEESQDPAKD